MEKECGGRGRHGLHPIPFQNINKNVAQVEQLFCFETVQEGAVTQCFYTGAHLFFAGAPGGSQSKAREGLGLAALPSCAKNESPLILFKSLSAQTIKLQPF